MPKLTLSVNDNVVTRAKQYSKQRGVSISAMVEAYLSAVVELTSAATRDTPILRSVRGSLKNADLNEYRSHLTEKYQ